MNREPSSSFSERLEEPAPRDGSSVRRMLLAGSLMAWWGVVVLKEWWDPKSTSLLTGLWLALAPLAIAIWVGSSRPRLRYAVVALGFAGALVMTVAGWVQDPAGFQWSSGIWVRFAVSAVMMQGSSFGDLFLQ